ncbi:MAG: hypothetical protein DMF66_01665 [Acidobacteria bacterium]|nr:MAG: hypothetical protein DMF66_01665 [Acidobacteriota bacterium]
MSAIAALLHLDGSPIDPAMLLGMMDAALPYGSEVTGSWIGGTIGMGECRSDTVEASQPEGLPLVDVEHDLVLVWDGRIDNRQELVGELERAQDCCRLSDATLFLEAYRRWGTRCLNRLVGDFAFVIWDGRVRRLLAGRDQLGIRPLHYCIDDTKCLIASRIDQLHEAHHLARKINEHTVGDFLIGNLDNPDETFFQGIHRVPPGYILEVDSRGVIKKTCYWEPDRDRTILCDSDTEYAERFHALLRQAVGDRLRTLQPIGLMLSSGLDSSSVACTVAGLDGESGLLPQTLATFTATFDDSLSLDTRSRVEPLINKYSFDATFVPGEPMWTFDRSEPAATSWPEPLEGMYVVTVQRLLDAARRRGIRVLLTGYGGDLVLAGNYYYLFDLLASARWKTLFSELGCYSITARARLVFNYLAKPLLLGRPESNAGYEVPPWLSPKFAARIDLKSRRAATPPQPRRRSVFRQAEFDAIRIVRNSAQMLWLQSEGLSHGVELRHPFLDRRLFEFLLALPSYQKVQQGRSKAILRRVVSHALPEAIHQQRNSPGEHVRTLKRVVREREQHYWETCFADPYSASLGYVDLPALRKAFRRYLGGDIGLKYALARIWRLELWLKGLLT